MSKTNEWIIGADPGCDVVIDAPAVSGRHCRLVRDTDGYTVEDLSSTNGTWVNGERITAVRRVSKKDAITLGQSVPLRWPEVKSKVSARTISIGRLPDNDIVYDDPMVSGHHAEITIKNGRTTIKDLGSTNGTSIGSVDRKIQAAPIEPTDTVFLGTLAFRVSDLLEPGNEPQPVEMTMPVSALPKELIDAAGLKTGDAIVGKSRWFLPAVIGGPALLTVAIITAIVANSGDDSGTDVAEKPVAPTDSKPAAVDPETALYLILVKDRDEGTAFRIGTAVAIGNRHLLTSGSVIKAIAQLQNEYPKVTAFCPKTEKQFLVDFKNAKSHPSFDKAYQTAKDAYRRYESTGQRMQKLVDEIGQFENVGGKRKGQGANAKSKPRIAELKKQITRLGQELQNWDDRVLTNSERAVCFDLGVLELKNATDVLPGHLNIAAANTGQQSGDAVVLWGNPFSQDSLLMSSYSGHQARKLTGRVRMRKRLGSQDADPFRLVVKSQQNLADNQWVGGAVLDGKNRIVGVFSRLTPSNADKPPQGDLFDVPLASRLRDFFSIDRPSSKSDKD